jgi:hypothetical protein
MYLHSIMKESMQIQFEEKKKTLRANYNSERKHILICGST